ncbi:MAG: hypothetical protein ABW194_01740 [Novosphingobium sp.]
MGKYDPLRRYLEGLETESWDARFSDVEKVLGFAIPDSATRHSAWWANETHGSHSHARSWQDAGWATRNVDLRGKRVRFERGRRRTVKDDAPTGSGRWPGPDLWEQARQISGIKERDKLIEAALLALIQREAGRQLIALGGTMPDAEAPPRERPFG